MSYTRDKDAHTRGVGAIAAADGSRVRRRRRAAIGRALRERDAVLSGLTYGPRGGLAGLGAIQLTGRADQLVRNRTTANPPYEGGDVGPAPGTVSIPQPGGRGGAPTTLVPIGAALRATQVNMSRGFAPVAPVRGLPPGMQPGTNVSPDQTVDGGGGASGGGGGGGTSSGGGGGSSGGGYTGGGGGGGGGGIMTGGGTAPDMTAPTSPDDVPAGAGMTNQTKLLLAAAAVGGLYLLFKKNKGQ